MKLAHPSRYREGIMDLGNKVYGSVVKADFTKEAYKNTETYTRNGRTKTILSSLDAPRVELDLSLLPAAAESYCLSPNADDYIVVSLPILTVDHPNRNMQAFPLQELSYFDPSHGKMVFQTFNWKPCHADHDNADPRKAKGIIVDSSMQYVEKYDLWKVNIITLWDRTKDAKLVEDILKKKRTGYSMGALVSYFACSICGDMKNECDHFKNLGRTYGPDNALSYSLCCASTFFENSSVTDPADASAHSQDIFI
jgi:hypothetical protein